MMLRDQNSKTGGSRRQRLWIPLLVAFIAIYGFLLPLAHPERNAMRLTPVEAAPLPLTTMADLEVELFGPQTVFAGEQITYTIVVQNKANDQVNDVVLIDTWVTNMAQNINTFWGYGVLPVFEGFHANPPNAVISYTHQVNDVNKRGEAMWWLSPMMAGDSIEIVFTVTVPITIQPTLDNYIAAPLATSHRLLGPSTVENSVFAKVGEEIFPSNLSTTQVVAPLLLLTQSAIGEGAALNECRVGRLLTYTITIENVLSRGDSWPATNMVVTKQLPAEVLAGFVTASASEPGVTWTYSESVGTLVWQFMPTSVLTRGEKAYVYYTVRVPADLSYNPRASYIETLGVPTGHVRARAALMPFREASLRSRHRVRILSPFDKKVETLSPPTHATTTFANRPITYTLTYYSPISTTASTTFEDRIHDTFVFLNTAGGDLPTPVVNGPQLVWENVTVPGYGIISTTFVVSVTPATEVQAGGAACRYISYYNAITATAELFPVPAYIGHDGNKLAALRVEPQLKVTKAVAPSSQIPGEEVTYNITVRNTGDTQIPAPIVITDILPADFVFMRMGDNSPGAPVVDGNVLMWDSIPQLAPGGSFVFSFVAEVDGPCGAKVKNYVAADSTETSLCEIESAQVTILSPFVGDKVGESWNHETITLNNNEFPLVRQGDPLTYTASIYNRSPRTTYTITHFLDILDDESLAAKDRTGLINSLDQSFEYLYTLPAPFVLDPDGQWEHTFGATMRGLGTGSLWCNNKEQIDKAKVEQAEEHVLYLMADDTVAFNPKKLAPVYVLPHVSMFQQAYPNPVAIGEIVTVVLTLRDNRTNPTVAVTGLNLQWLAPNDFTLLSADPAPTSSDETSASWSNVDIPAGGEQVFLIHMRAPVQKEPGWSRKYSATAEVLALDDVNICVPKSTRFVESKSGAVEPDHDAGLPGPIPDFNDQKYVQLEVNQGIELNKTAKPKEIGPYGMVEYEIVIKNLTGAPVAPIVITDTLPYLDINSWEYLETIDGMQPHGENPLYWNIGVMDPLSEVRMVLKTRAALWLGLALNNLEGSAPININYHRNYAVNMSVNVVSGIGFYKVAEPTAILAGEATTYTIRLYNGALYDIQSVVITDTLPPGFYFDGMVSPLGLQPQISETQLIWTIPSKINKTGGVYEIVFRARTRTTAEGMLAGKYYNAVSASAKKFDTGEPVEMPPTGPTAPVYVEGLAAVDVHKTATPQTVMQGQEVVYHIALHNEYTETRTLQITDTLPVYFTLAELIDPPNADISYVRDQQQITWRDVTLAAGAELTITFHAKVSEDAAPGRYDNVIQVQIDDLVMPPSQPMASVWVEELPRADGQVSKTDGRLIAQKGARIDYTITYHNASAEIAFQSIVLTETISPITYVTVLGGDWNPVGDGRFWREIFEVLEPGESRTVQFSIELSPDIPDDYQWLHNHVELGYTTAQPAIESTPGDNVADDVNRIIGSGDSVVIVKAASYAGDTLVAGQELTYTITLFNVLTQTQSVRITDTLPVSFTLSAALSPPAIELTQTVDGHQLVVWDGLTIPGENSISIIFRARVDPDAEQGAACNSVQVQLGDGQVLPATGPLACVDVQRLWKVDAYVNKANTDNKGWASPGDTVHYLIQYGNANTSQTALATIVLTETISPPAVIDAMLSDHWVSLGNGKYRRTLSGADLAPGGTGQLYFSIRLSDTIPANVTSVHNQVEIGFITAEPSVEVNPSNNVSTDVTAVQEAIHQVYLPLVIRK